MLGHQTTFFLIKHLFLAPKCVDFVMPCFTSTGVQPQVVCAGLCLRLENVYSKLYWSLINEFISLCVCLLEFAVSLYMVFIEVRGSLDSKECTLSGFDSYPLCNHHCYYQKAVLLLENLPWR
uniref:Uncharacterized protein n=1 Tax=Molossus molossus TaxID=27622 RepID=A0A7J8HCF8_MOLMO|nr:hypothetical protein HJG59_011098 [Molossus molossus]